MSAVFAESSLEYILDRARSAAARDDLPFAGEVGPRDAWALFLAGEAMLIDIRSPEERKFVGEIPGVPAVVWASGTNLTRNPRFLRELEAKVRKTDVVLLLCRSGKRSADAADLATASGFTNVFNVAEGFEGDKDDQGRRSRSNGWRFHGLPWVQD
jgi:rhodanese-related sulfurtransferase